MSEATPDDRPTDPAPPSFPLEPPPDIPTAYERCTLAEQAYALWSGHWTAALGAFERWQRELEDFAQLMTPNGRLSAERALIVARLQLVCCVLWLDDLGTALGGARLSLVSALLEKPTPLPTFRALAGEDLAREFADIRRAVERGGRVDDAWWAEQLAALGFAVSPPRPLSLQERVAAAERQLDAARDEEDMAGTAHEALAKRRQQLEQELSDLRAERDAQPVAPEAA